MRVPPTSLTIDTEMTQEIRPDDALAIFVTNGNKPSYVIDDIVVHGHMFVMAAILLGIPYIEVQEPAHMDGFGVW